MLRHLVTGTAFAIVASTAASAQEWSSQVTPYVWATGLGGDLTPFSGAPTLSFDKGFSELIKDLNGAFFVSAYARRERLVLMGDFSWFNSSKSGNLQGNTPARGKLSQKSLTLLAGWQAVKNDKMTLDVLAGARAWNVKTSVKVAGGALSASRNKKFIDPIVAVRANIALAPQWSAIAYADFGGFGVGSKRTSQFMATVNYEVSDRAWISAGYRQLNVRYEGGGTAIDVKLSGPLLGATWRF